MLNAFCRVAPSVLFNFLAMTDAVDFLRAIVRIWLTSPEVHARRFFFLFAINPPFQERQLVSLTGANEKLTDWMMIVSIAVERLPHKRPWNCLATVQAADVVSGYRGQIIVADRRQQIVQGGNKCFACRFLACRKPAGKWAFRRSAAPSSYALTRSSSTPDVLRH
jgi:hypothetical protein